MSGDGRATRTAGGRESERLVVLGFDPGATTGWAYLEVSLAAATWIAAGAERDPSELLHRVQTTATLDLVALERVATVFPRDRFGTAMARDLAHASWIGGEIAGAVRMLRRAVAECEATEWRKALVGATSPSDAKITRALRMHLRLPARSNAHERDAAGVALFCARRELLRQRVVRPARTEGP